MMEVNPVFEDNLEPPKKRFRKYTPLKPPATTVSLDSTAGKKCCSKRGLGIIAIVALGILAVVAISVTLIAVFGRPLKEATTSNVEALMKEVTSLKTIMEMQRNKIELLESMVNVSNDKIELLESMVNVSNDKIELSNGIAFRSQEKLKLELKASVNSLQAQIDRLNCSSRSITISGTQSKSLLIVTVSYYSWSISCVLTTV